MFLLVNVTLDFKHALAHGTVNYLRRLHSFLLQILDSLFIFDSFLKDDVCVLYTFNFDYKLFFPNNKIYQNILCVSSYNNKCVWYLIVLFNIDCCHREYETRSKLS